MARPSTEFLWAQNPDKTDNDITDPVSGQDNVLLEASYSQEILNGFSYRQKPSFNVFNGMMRRIAQWLQYFGEAIDSAVVPYKVDAIYLGSAKTGNATFRKIGSTVFMELPSIIGVDSTVTNTFQLLIGGDDVEENGDNAPAWCVPSVGQFLPFIFLNGNEIVNGVLERTNGGYYGVDWWPSFYMIGRIYPLDSANDHKMLSTGFYQGAGAIAQGIPKQVIVYNV